MLAGAVVGALAALVAGIAIGYAVRGPGASKLAVSPSPSNLPSVGSGNGAAISSKVYPGLVNVNVTLGYQNETAAGTGMVVTSTGEVLTSNHLIENATSISVVDVGNHKTYTATVEGYDPADDIAVLSLQGASGLATVLFADPSAVAVGLQVVAIGNSGAGGPPSLASGTITGVDQSITATDQATGSSEQLTGLIETNAPIQSGDSGGPLVTGSGTVIGMTTATSSGYSFSGAASQGYAIPTDMAHNIAAQITSGQASATTHIGPTPFLGLQVTTSPAFGGPQTAVVVAVLPGSPAQDAGVGIGDTIGSLDGQSIDTPDQLTTMLLAYQPDDTVQLGWQDASGQAHTASVTLTAGPPA